jgi:G:T-mismatch repair DNA endonuclease (very short patch repair protein)
LEKVAQQVSRDHQVLVAQLENKVWQVHLVQREIEAKLVRQEIVVT